MRKVWSIELNLMATRHNRHLCTTLMKGIPYPYLNVLHEPGVGGLVRAGEGGAPGGPEAAPPLLVELHARQAVRAARGAEPAVHSHAARRRGVQGWKLVDEDVIGVLLTFVHKIDKNKIIWYCDCPF